MNKDFISYQVTPEVLLAGQPQIADWAALAQAGYATVVNLRGDAERAAEQGRNAAAAGLRYVYRPWPAYELEREHVDELASILAAPDTGRLVFHCRTATRVGLMWLLYRQLHHGWTRDQAVAELVAAGYDADALETFDYCADEYFERTGETVAS
ncbi:MAG: hypothetical protein EI684_16635 [Candidatus Viridilinea halotolerans]|uniref:Beta-lactamase hydrolase-like protein phosphatase-like domain-containing protein n=1 Tax=Candidatus Viridilinea halotolerans TaxID=2491704 RepID=A0A426TUQ4_9CHLR|nr:MAG: hypothetical protein EI684_16635 [Candidatus Viridilinea halotolerans]